MTSTLNKNLFKVLILTDSRGKGLEEVIKDRSLDSQNIKPTIITRPGITLEHCVDIAITKGNDPTHQFDLIIIQAGICDFTVRNRQGNIKILNYIRNEQVAKIESYLVRLRQNLGSKINVATIIPASLSKYLSFHQRFQPNINIPDKLVQDA